MMGKLIKGIFWRGCSTLRERKKKTTVVPTRPLVVSHVRQRQGGLGPGEECILFNPKTLHNHSIDTKCRRYLGLCGDQPWDRFRVQALGSQQSTPNRCMRTSHVKKSLAV